MTPLDPNAPTTMPEDQATSFVALESYEDDVDRRQVKIGESVIDVEGSQ